MSNSNKCLDAFLVVDCNYRRRARLLPCEDRRKVGQAMAEIGRGVIEGAITDATEPINPDALIEAYIASGGNWHDLTTAVNRHALEGATKELN